MAHLFRRADSDAVGISTGQRASAASVRTRPSPAGIRDVDAVEVSSGQRASSASVRTQSSPAENRVPLDKEEFAQRYKLVVVGQGLGWCSPRIYLRSHKSAGSSPSRPAANRTTETEEEGITQVPESPKQKMVSCLGMRRDSCTVCRLPVFLAEKLVVAHLIYHRTCFRCARCNNQLTHGNYYETETDEFCCEACPDEEVSSSEIQKYNSTPTIITTLGETDENEITSDSSDQESASNPKERDQNILSHNTIKGSQPEDPVIPKLVAETSRLRLNFISNHLLSKENDEIVVNDDSTDGDSKFFEKHTVNFQTGAAHELDSAVLANDEFVIKKGIGESANFVDTCLKFESENLQEDTLTQQARSSTNTNSISNILNCSMEKDVPKPTFSSICTIDNDKFNNLVTKTNNTKEQLDNTDEHESTESRISLVQERLKLFENGYKKDHIKRRENKSQNIEVETSKTQSNRHIEPSSEDQIDLTLDIEAEKEQKLLDDGIETSNHNTIEGTNDNSIMFSAESYSMLNSDVTGSMSVPGSDIPDDVGNSNIEESEENVISTSETASVSPSKSSKNLEEIIIDRGSSESQTANDVTAQSKQSYENKSVNKDYPEDLNPFKSDDEDVGDHPTSINTFRSSTDLSNPFENETTVKKEVTPPKPAKRTNFSDTSKQQTTIDVQTKRRLPAPQINLNPFWSDEDDHDSDLEFQGKTPEQVPIPKQRTYNRSLYASSTSLTSSEFGATPGVTPRKKQPAPLPPNNKDLHAPEQRTSLAPDLQNTSAEYHKSHQRTTLKARKSKPAPPPPIATSTPYNAAMVTPLTLEESPINESCNITSNENLWEDKKMDKDEANRTKQSLTHISYADNPDYHSPYTDKSTQGKWKRKKNPAPPCPIPHRRKIKVMSLEDVKLELDEIELQQQGLEKQGVRLEQLIRNKCETGSNNDDVSMRSDVEELVLELFALVNEKNELFRRQAELMLLRRQQRLEEEHVEVEYQIRCLMSQSESTKTDYDKQREEALIQRLVQIVERRNEIIECLEMDRRREIEEDKSIHKHMGLFAAKTKSEAPDNDMNLPCCSKMKKDKPKKKTKEKKSKKMSKKDIDKDIDEAEINHKRYNKRKWF
ncbi:MICAL-like protein isoform X3 [Lasioglossum baleicum]|uniref:MICAL-like protein isoform X3 n=1 Tax=Lasioglossum baleicum TaxID=434251 RepID=UPI003FCC638B